MSMKQFDKREINELIESLAIIGAFTALLTLGPEEFKKEFEHRINLMIDDISDKQEGSLLSMLKFYVEVLENHDASSTAS
jgi:hypothetical protein